MYAAVTSYTLQGISGLPVTVEVDLSNGLPAFQLVGLPSTSIRESKDRVRAAIQNSGFSFPMGRLTVNLAPADLRKEGPSLDLSICIAILAASDQLSINLCKNCVFLGEIALDGSLLPIRGVLSLIYDAAKDGNSRIFIPASNEVFPHLLQDVEVIPVGSLKECVEVLKGALKVTSNFSLSSGTEKKAKDKQMLYTLPATAEELDQYPSFDTIRGQWQAKRALLIAASGGHHLLLAGPPGTGKTMLCRTLPRLLPPLQLEEAIELQKIYSTQAAAFDGGRILSGRPFRAPHHSMTMTALLGGGGYVKPGEITLAHAGILFLDELLEFSRTFLDQLREPLERKRILIARANSHCTFPADFQLVAACNPCPCGYYGAPGFRGCSCLPHIRATYQSRISGPLLDRFDIRVYVPPLKLTYEDQFTSAIMSEAEAIEAIQLAWEVQRKRNGTFPVTGRIRKNAHLTGARIEACVLTQSAVELVKRLEQSNAISGRGREALLRVAQTVADLEQSNSIDEMHIAEAYQLRTSLFNVS